MIVLVAMCFLGLQGDARPRLRATPDAGPPPYVGQGVGIHVAASGFAGEPVVRPPQISGADILEAGGDAGGRRFVLVPRREGLIRVTPFSARFDDEAASSPAIEVRARPAPRGAPASCLGGVGAIEVEASFSATTTRLGGAVEYRLILRGPGALGSTRIPAVRWPRGLDARPIAAPPIAIEPPIRRLAWTVRPLVAGRFAVPPVPVSVLDPSTGRYLTVPSRSMHLDAVDREPEPVSDPAMIEQDAADPPWAWVAVTLSVVLGCSAVGLIARRRLRSDPAGLARRLARALPAGAEPAEAARRVVAALIAALGPTGGELTPAEARHRVMETGGGPGVADRVEQLVAACDRARYSGRDADARALLAEGRGALIALANVARRNSSKPSRITGGRSASVARETGGTRP